MVKILKGKKCVGEVSVAESFFSKVRGLMFVRKPQGMLLDFKEEGSWSIWMLFMNFPLDLIFISEKGEVVDLKRDVKPLSLNPYTWKVYWPKVQCRWVLELPANQKKLNVGDIVNFI